MNTLKKHNKIIAIEKTIICLFVILKLVKVSVRITGNVLGIAEGGEIEAISFDFARRRAKTNFYEKNLRKKTNKIRFWRNSRAEP